MTKTRTLFYSVVVFGARTEVALNVFESFFWLLDVMQQLSWKILLDEAVKEGRNHKRGNTRMSGTPRLSAWGDRVAAGEIKGKARPRYWLPNNEPCLSSILVRHQTWQWSYFQCHNVFQRRVCQVMLTYLTFLTWKLCKWILDHNTARNRISTFTCVIESSGLLSV